METNEIIMNEEVVDDVMEVVADAPEVDWGKIGFGALALCAIAALGYKGYRIWKDKKQSNIPKPCPRQLHVWLR